MAALRANEAAEGFINGKHLMNRISRGFTLLEMMIVVVIIAILAAVAYPNYRRYVQRSNRADAKDLAMRIAAAEERRYTNLNRYTDQFTGDDSLQMSEVSERGLYTAQVQLGNGDQTFTLLLVPGGSQASDACGTLTINNTGFKDWTGDKPPSNGACW